MPISIISPLNQQLNSRNINWHLHWLRKLWWSLWYLIELQKISPSLFKNSLLMNIKEKEYLISKKLLSMFKFQLNNYHLNSWCQSMKDVIASMNLFGIMSQLKSINSNIGIHHWCSIAGKNWWRWISPTSLKIWNTRDNIKQYLKDLKINLLALPVLNGDTFFLKNLA